MAGSRPLSLAAGDLDCALERAGDGAFVVGGDGRILLWNPAAERILGYTAREVVGKACCEVLAGRDADDNRLCYRGCHVMSLIDLGEAVQNFDMTTRTKGGRPVWINISILALPSPPGEKGLTAHLFRDVTDRHELLALIRERLTSPPAGVVAEETLTRREIEVLKLMAAGLNTAGLAARLHVSPVTIRNHVQHILDKLGVHSRLEAVAIATRRRWL
jgi:PAS domain S-box-containing protein